MLQRCIKPITSSGFAVIEVLFAVAVTCAAIGVFWPANGVFWPATKSAAAQHSTSTEMGEPTTQEVLQSLVQLSLEFKQKYQEYPESWKAIADFCDASADCTVISTGYQYGAVIKGILEEELIDFSSEKNSAQRAPVLKSVSSEGCLHICGGGYTFEIEEFANDSARSEFSITATPNAAESIDLNSFEVAVIESTGDVLTAKTQLFVLASSGASSTNGLGSGDSQDDVIARL